MPRHIEGPKWDMSQSNFDCTTTPSTEVTGGFPAPLLNESCTVDQFSRRLVGKPRPLTKRISHTFRKDVATDTWLYIELENGFPKKEIAVAKGYDILSYTECIDPQNGKAYKYIVQLITDSMHQIVIPAEDAENWNLAPYFNQVTRYPGCSKRMFNELLAFQISSARSTKLTAYQNAGFHACQEGGFIFASKQTDTSVPAEIMSESVNMRPLAETPTDRDAFIASWIEFYSSNPKLLIIGLLVIACILLFFFDMIDMFPLFMLMIRPSETCTQSQLKAMMCLHDSKLCPILNLESKPAKIQQYLSKIYDGTALFIDDSLADERARIEESVRCLVKTTKRNADRNSSGRNIITIISRYAAGTVRSVSEGNALILSMDDVKGNINIDYLHYLTKGMESLIVSTVQQNPAEIMKFFERKREYYNWLAVHGEPETGIHAAAKMLTVTRDFMQEFLQIEEGKFNDCNRLLLELLEREDLSLDYDQILITDVYTELSKRIRNRELLIMQKHQKITVDTNNPSAIIDGDRIYLNDETLDSLLQLNQIQMRHSRRGFLNLLRQYNLLVAKDGNTKPIQVYDLNGKSQRLYWYCIDASILDADVLHRLHNIDSEQFWLAPNEVPDRDFMPLLRDESGRVAGKLMRQQDAENGHVYVSGQSGVGKTYADCQLMARNLALGHNVVAFDSSDSFTFDTMCCNLSSEFVTENVTFIDIDSVGIPVDFFRINRTVSKPTQKTALMDILTAGIGELSTSQKNRLRAVLSEMLDLIDKTEPIHPCDILTMLQEDGATYESLRARLEPLLEDIELLGMAAQSWRELLRQNAGKIIVISTASGSSERGNQLIDMLLETLFRYQREQSEIPLDLVLDEIQNQNFTEGSPICRILKEGRHSLISFIGSTQDYYARSTEIGKVMGKAGIQIFLRPTQDSEGTVASELRFGKADRERFDAMQRGDVIIKGPFYDKEQHRNIPATLSGHVVSFLPEEP